MICALEVPIRISSSRNAKKLFGTTDAEALSLPEKIHDAVSAEFYNSRNIVGTDVKTGDAMIRGDAYFYIFISCKSKERRHVSMEYLQPFASEGSTPVVRLYHTGKEVTCPGTFNFSDR